MPDRKKLEQVAAEEFAKLEQQAASAGPGILELLEVYGKCEEALRQAQVFQQLVYPVPSYYAAASTSPSEFIRP